MGRRVKWLFGLAAVGLAVWGRDVAWGARGVAAAEPDRFMADLAVRRGVMPDGRTSIEWTPERQYHVERERGARAWRTTLRIMDESGKRPATAVGSPSDIVAVVDSGDDDPLQFIDRAGRARPADEVSRVDSRIARARPPDVLTPPVVRRRTSGFDWLEGVVQSAAARDRRARAALASLGPVRGHVRGLDQYVTVEGGRRREVLMDPVMTVPVEMTISEGGHTTSQLFFRYQPDGRGNVVRTALQSRRHAIEDSMTSALDVQFSHVRVPQGGAR